jgi:hypothetical protein
MVDFLRVQAEFFAGKMHQTCFLKYDLLTKRSLATQDDRIHTTFTHKKNLAGPSGKVFQLTSKDRILIRASK